MSDAQATSSSAEQAQAPQPSSTDPAPQAKEKSTDDQPSTAQEGEAKPSGKTFESWKSERIPEIAKRRRQAEKEAEHWRQVHESEKYRRIEAMREQREMWQADRKNRSCHLASTMAMFSHYKEKEREKDETRKIAEKEKILHYEQRRREIHEDSVASRATLLRLETRLEPLLYDVEKSAIARFLHAERKQLSSSTLPRNVAGHTRAVQTIDIGDFDP